MIDRQDVIECCLRLFEKEGVKFSMLDIATSLKTSKRTIYKYFKGKTALIEATIDYIFDDIERQHKEILKKDISAIEKLKEVLLTYPTVVSFEEIKVNKIIELEPDIHNSITKHLESNWDLTLELFEECKKLGQIKNVSSNIFRCIFLGVYKQSVSEDKPELIQQQCLQAIMEGLVV